jgi:hypothetical protein
MMQSTKFGSSKTIHIAFNDGENTLPICGAQLRWGLPHAISHEVTCKKCQKVAA